MRRVGQGQDSKTPCSPQGVCCAPKRRVADKWKLTASGCAQHVSALEPHLSLQHTPCEVVKPDIAAHSPQATPMSAKFFKNSQPRAPAPTWQWDSEEQGAR